ncbi:IclR family transcriptional regulator [Phytoactinopolyspora halophila]|uniref:IclR family transcriptional regulator n=1 Tax=Phytoactinopolyspora halophila TaxID=1981511 RepID=UPI001314C57D|nr:IclR family transcriptional regulator [Phytoactinopolyspora halophila]
MESTSNGRNAGHIQSVERAIAILELLARDEWAGVTDVGNALGVHKSTAFRLLNTLESRGLAERNLHTGKYRLGFGLVHLAHAVTVEHDVTRQAQVGCEWLAQNSEETVTLSVLEANESVTIDQILSTSTVASRSWLGRRTPLHCTAPGKVLLAYLGEEEREEIIAGPHERYTDYTILDPQQLREEIERVRAHAYATTYEEFEDELSAAASPVYSTDGSVVAAIGLSGPSYRLDREQLAASAPVVREAAELASAGFGHTDLTDYPDTSESDETSDQ